jgi:hypothetical protein
MEEAARSGGLFYPGFGILLFFWETVRSLLHFPSSGIRQSAVSPLSDVYLDGQEFGPINILRNIPASEISSIRLYARGKRPRNSGLAIRAESSR